MCFSNRLLQFLYFYYLTLSGCQNIHSRLNGIHCTGIGRCTRSRHLLFRARPLAKSRGSLYLSYRDDISTNEYRSTPFFKQKTAYEITMSRITKTVTIPTTISNNPNSMFSISQLIRIYIKRRSLKKDSESVPKVENSIKNYY